MSHAVFLWLTTQKAMNTKNDLEDLRLARERFRQTWREIKNTSAQRNQTDSPYQKHQKDNGRKVIIIVFAFFAIVFWFMYAHTPATTHTKITQ
jgi:hypothetical protein